MGIHYIDSNPTSHRVKVLKINGTILLDIFRGLNGRRLLKCSPIPDDARVVGYTVDEMWDTISVYVESQEFEEVEAGLYPPEMELTVSVREPKLADERGLLFNAFTT